MPNIELFFMFYVGYISTNKLKKKKKRNTSLLREKKNITDHVLQDLLMIHYSRQYGMLHTKTNKSQNMSFHRILQRSTIHQPTIYNSILIPETCRIT